MLPCATCCGVLCLLCWPRCVVGSQLLVRLYPAPMCCRLLAGVMCDMACAECAMRWIGSMRRGV